MATRFRPSRTLILIAALLALVPALFAQSVHPIAKINPPAEGTFPGGRGANELIVYTPFAGRTSTGTNPWGSEAIVRGGVVVANGGNDNAIPADGFVVSGHGDAARWISQTLHPGVALYFTRDELHLDTSPAAEIRSLLYRVDALAPRIASLADPGGYGERAATLAERLRAVDDPAAAPADPVAALRGAVDELDQEVWTMELESTPAPAGEIHAVWYRPREKSRAEVAALAEAWAAAGVNVVFPETIYASQAIHLDASGFYARFPQFGEFDVLAAMIEECHARGIEVHAWVHCFFIGIVGSTDEPPLLAEAHPEWLAVNREGRRPSIVEPNYLFFNPAIPELRARMIAAYTALARDYAIDGFQFDYIRYGQAESWKTTYDFSDDTRARVRGELGFDPLAITPDANPAEWARWLAWRENVITSFVDEAGAAVRAVRPGLILSADVFPDIDSAVAIKAQNWAEWGRSGRVDALVPMAYVTDAMSITGAVRELDGAVPEGKPLVVGIGPFLGLTPRQLVEQIGAAREAGATGQALFNWENTTPAMQDALARGPWRNTAKPAW